MTTRFSIVFETEKAEEQFLALLSKEYPTAEVKMSEYSVTVPEKEEAPAPEPVPEPPPPPPAPKPLLTIDFTGKPDGIVAGEVNKTLVHPDLDMTSGSLFIKNGKGYSGLPLETNNFGGFRMVTKRRDFLNVIVRVELMINQMNG